MAATDADVVEETLPEANRTSGSGSDVRGLLGESAGTPACSALAARLSLSLSFFLSFLALSKASNSALASSVKAPDRVAPLLWLSRTWDSRQ